MTKKKEEEVGEPENKYESTFTGIVLPPKVEEQKKVVNLSEVDKLLVAEGLGQNARKKVLKLVREAYGE